MKKLFLFAVSVAATASAVFAAERPEVLCIYYPEWHVYPEWEAYYGKGTTEWSCVTNARPRFPGHYQPIVPLMGYYDESKPETAAKEIDLAADAGIDVFIYDWYWANKKPIQHEGLENGILKAPNRDRIKFAVMWAYHDRDVPFQSAFGEEKKHYLWKLERTPEDFLEAFEYCAKKYFTEPTYWRKDGHPFFSMYACDSFVKDMGGPEKTKAVLERAQAIVKAMGLPSVHFNAMVYNADYSKASIAAGFHSTTVYSMHGYHYKKGEKMELAREFIMEYADLMKAMVDVNSALAKVSPMHIPLVQRGWDCTPRCDPKEPFPWRKSHYPYMGIYADVTPAKFEAALRAAKAQALADPKKPGAVLINAWNEYTEGSWLVPDTRDGDAYLRAVERVFGWRKAVPAVSEGSLLRMGPMRIAPVIDGSISSDEARASSAQYGAISATTGLMSKRYAAFQFGYTDKGFYFASRTSLPNAPQTLVAEDAVTFSLLPPGAGKPLEFRLCLADGKGNLPEGSSSAVKPLVGVSDYGVLCTEAEIFVPYSAVGLKRPADGGKWGLQMTVDFSSVRETARWHNPAVADEMGSFIPDASCPVPGIANFYMLEQYRESGNYCFAFIFDNFSGKDAMLRSKTLFHRGIGLAKLDSNPEKDVDIQHVPFKDLDKVTLPAAKNTEIVHKEWVIWPGSVSILDIDLSSDGKDFFRRKIRWDVAVGKSWSDGKGLPFIRSAFFPTSGNRLRVRWDFNRIADVVRADLRVKGRKSGKVFFETALDVGKRNGVLDTHLPELPLDDYIVRFSVTDGKGEKYKHDGSFRVAKFPWQNARIGEERVVVPPYVPIVAKGDETRFLQTAYRSSGVFWDRVDALGENILAAPVELRMNGKAFPVSSQRIVSADKDRVVREVVGEKDGIRLVATQTYDYDGFCWVRLKFDAPSSVTVNSLQVVMPLKNEIARLFGVLNRSDKRSGPAPDFTLPSREGEVWNSAENTRLKGILRSFPAPIQPYVWFGGPFKGFCWLMESVRDMSLEKTVPAQRIVRANGAATLTCDLVNVPVEWTGEKVFEMGFQPTPTRPKDPAHGVFASRMYRYNTPTNAVVYQHGFPFMLHPIHTPFGTFPGNDTSLMDWTRSQKKRDRGAYLAKLKEYITTHEDWFAKSRVSSASAYYTAAVNHDRQMGIEISPCYLNPMLITSFWPEWEMYKSEWYPEEWTHDNYFNEYMAYTSKTRIDKLMWDVKLALDLGFDGIYYDCFRSCGGRSLANPDVYIRKDGSVQAALTNVRAWREIMKRTATACYVRGKMYNGRPLVENHDTNGHIVPIMSFAMGGLSTERGSAGGEFPIRFPEGYTLAEITGGQTGKGTRYIVSTKKGDTAQQERELRSLMGFMCAYGMFSICDQNIIPRAWFDKAWNTVFDFGWGRPGVKQHFYWDGKPQPVTHDGRDVRVTVAEKSDAALLMFGNLGDAAKVRFDVSGLGFGKVRMTDIDTGAVISEPVIDIVRHGYRMIRVDKEK